MSPLAVALAIVAQTPAPTSQPVEIPFRPLSFGSNVRIKDAGANIIRDAKGFDEYRKVMEMSDTRKPTIDWKKEQLVSIYTSGTGYGAATLEVTKVRRKSDGNLEIEASLNREGRAALPQPGDIPLLRKVGFFALIAVEKGRGDATLKLIDPKG